MHQYFPNEFFKKTLVSFSQCILTHHSDSNFPCLSLLMVFGSVCGGHFTTRVAAFKTIMAVFQQYYLISLMRACSCYSTSCVDSVSITHKLVYT